MSAVHWSTTLKFPNKEQRNSFVHLLLKKEIDYSFEVYSDYEDTSFVYYIHIEDMCWGGNLVEIAEDLKNVMEEDDEP